MTLDAVAKAPEKLTDTSRSGDSHDNLASYRTADASLTNAVYRPNTADVHLPHTVLIADSASAAPARPVPPQETYHPADIAIANQHFTPAEAKALQVVGPQNFNQMMEAVKNAPAAQSQALVNTFKFVADAELKHEHDYPTH
jgi:hypothetical protein